MIGAVRLFVALFLPESVLAEVQRVSSRFSCPRLRWTPPASLHVTLQFLGEASPAQAAAAETAVAAAASRCRRLHLSVSGAGVFPSASRPRVFWAGLSGDVERLSGLAGDLDAALAPVGIPSEARGFSPHLTLARCRADAKCLPADAKSFTETAGAIQTPAFDVDAIHLVRSHLSGAGARYEILQSSALAA